MIAATLQPRTLSSLALEHLYDTCAQIAATAVNTESTAGGVGIVASTPYHARQLVSRLNGRALIVPTSGWYSPDNPDALTAFPYFQREQFAVPIPSVRCGCVIWAAPKTTASDDDSAAVWIRHIDNILAPDGVLCILLTGRLAFRLPEHDAIGKTISARKAIRLLRENQYSIQRTVYFHGIVSYSFALMNILMAKLRQPDIADRWEFRMRSAFSARFGAQKLSTVGLIVAAKR